VDVAACPCRDAIVNFGLTGGCGGTGRLLSPWPAGPSLTLADAKIGSALDESDAQTRFGTGGIVALVKASALAELWHWRRCDTDHDAALAG
jgi:hypothetical protein